MGKQLWIIGVSSPCPRCDLLRQRVEMLTKEAETSVDIKKIVYTEPEAVEFAASIGKVPGTSMNEAAGGQPPSTLYRSGEYEEFILM